jgi:broad specificity phosphatase PhoE
LVFRYNDIKSIWPDQYALRKADKLHYRYPGVGGESYLDVINRLRAVIVEVERMTDHVLLIGHRVVARVLLAYFLGLDRKDVAKLDVPLGRIYGLEPVRCTFSSILSVFTDMLTCIDNRNLMGLNSTHISTTPKLNGSIKFQIASS